MNGINKNIIWMMLFLIAAHFYSKQYKTFGGNQVQVEPGVFSFYFGDLKREEYVDGLDNRIFNVDNHAIDSGYLTSDA